MQIVKKRAASSRLALVRTLEHRLQALKKEDERAEKPERAAASEGADSALAASDAAAEAFARALSAADTIRDPAAWVWRVAFRVATAEAREARRRPAVPETSYEIG